MTLEILHQNVEEERTGKKEHVVFSISEKNEEAKSKIKLKGNSECGDFQGDKEVLLLVLSQQKFSASTVEDNLADHFLFIFALILVIEKNYDYRYKT